MATEIELEPVSLVENTTHSPSLDQTRPDLASHVFSDNNAPSNESVQCVSRIRRVTVTLQLSCINFAWNASKGLTIVGLPRMTADLKLPRTLAFWPSSVPGLSMASTLLLAGAVGDVMGPKYVNLTGGILNGFFMIGCGLSRHSQELVVFRALSGVAMAMHLSSSVALVSKVCVPGKGRNLSFACLGMSQVLGFSFGLVIGGILVNTSGWRSGWFLYGAITLTMSAVGFWSLPDGPALGSWRALCEKLFVKVDWIGALLASTFMALDSYFLAVISTDIDHAKEPANIAIISTGILALPLFLTWTHRQTLSNRSALIPNSLWRNSSFTSICAATALSFAVLNSLELFASLFFQEIQHLAAMQAAVRILPSVVVGVVLNFTTGIVIHRIPVVWLIVITSILSSGAPLLMALIQVHGTYWTNAFFAQILMPFSVDVLLTVGLVVVTTAFPEDKQAVAGAVFNTAAQFGSSLGLAIMQVVSTIITRTNSSLLPSEALLEGYRASFWTMFAFMVSSAVIGGIGLLKAGKVGLKQE